MSGYSQGKLYDQVRQALPEGTEIAPGTTGADLLAQAPPDALTGIPEAQRQQIASMDVSVRHGIDFAAIFQELVDTQFPGWVVVEQSRSDISPLVSAQTNAAFVKQLGYSLELPAQ